MSEVIKGYCLCGASGLEAVANAKFAIQCHCRDCQHISGGGHLPQIAVPFEGFVSWGQVKVYRSTSEAGNIVSLAFCAECGSPLFKSTSKMTDIVFLCAGPLEEDPVREPFQKVFEDCRRIWDT